MRSKYVGGIEFKPSIISVLLTKLGNILTSHEVSQFEFTLEFFVCLFFSGPRPDYCVINGTTYKVRILHL